jgi:hypothetical protein
LACSGALRSTRFTNCPSANRFFPGLRAWIGFPTANVPYDRDERAAGTPQQTFRRLVRYALDGHVELLAAGRCGC